MIANSDPRSFCGRLGRGEKRDGPAGRCALELRVAGLLAVMLGLAVALTGCERNTGTPTPPRRTKLTEKDMVGTYSASFPTGTTLLYLEQEPNVYWFEIRWADGTVYRSGKNPWKAYLPDVELKSLPDQLLAHLTPGRWSEDLERPLSAEECEEYRRVNTSCTVGRPYDDRICILVGLDPEVWLCKQPSGSKDTGDSSASDGDD
jgi:hypothetical protein